jgi:hypothetical protein
VLPHVARAVPTGAIQGSLCPLCASPVLAGLLLGLQAMLLHVAPAVPAGAILGSLCLLITSPLLADALLWCQPVLPHVAPAVQPGPTPADLAVLPASLLHAPLSLAQPSLLHEHAQELMRQVEHHTGLQANSTPCAQAIRREGHSKTVLGTKRLKLHQYTRWDT